MRSRVVVLVSACCGVLIACGDATDQTDTDSAGNSAKVSTVTDSVALRGENDPAASASWNTRILTSSVRRFRPAGWSNDSLLWGLVRDSITVVNVNSGDARTYAATGWAVQATHDIVSWQNANGAWMMRVNEQPRLLPMHNGVAPSRVVWSANGRRAILAWEGEGRAHQEVFELTGARSPIDPRIAGYYGDRAALWLDSSRVLFEIVAGAGRNGATGYKESGWRGDLAVLDLRSLNYTRVTDAGDDEYLRVAGPHRDGVLVTQWGAPGVDRHWWYDKTMWKRSAIELPAGRVFSSIGGATVVFTDAEGDSATALLFPAPLGVRGNETRSITIGKVARDAQPAFSPGGAIGSVHTGAGTVLLIRGKPTPHQAR
jgi:hypothetical protein